MKIVNRILFFSGIFLTVLSGTFVAKNVNNDFVMARIKAQDLTVTQTGIKQYKIYQKIYIIPVRDFKRHGERWNGNYPEKYYVGKIFL